MTRARAALALGACLTLVACRGLPPSPGELFLGARARNVALVVGAEGQALGLGVVVHASYEHAVLLLGRPARDLPPEVAVILGEARVPVEVAPAGEIALLTLRRAGRDLRPVSPAPPRAGPVWLLGTPVGPWVELWGAELTVPQGGPPQLQGLVPLAGGEVTPPAAAMAGAPVFGPGGGLIGICREAGAAARLELLPTPLLLGPILDQLVVLGSGAEVLEPNDASLTYRIGLEQVADLPPLEDSWGAPDFFLACEVGGRRLEALPCSPRDLPQPPRVVQVPAPGPLSAQLIERDVTLVDGLQERALTPPVARPGLAPRLELRLPLLLPPGAGPARLPAPRMVLTAEAVDTEGQSGPDRLPLGAQALAAGRVASGGLDLLGGDGSDFWTLTLPDPLPVSCVLVRGREPGALELAGFAPSFPERLLQLTPPPSRRLTVARVDLPAGTIPFRMRQLASSDAGPVAYRLLIAPAGDAEGLVRGLFRLISLESQHEDPYLESPEFAEEVAVALAVEAHIPRDDATRAILAELGHRNAAVRHLALRLLEVHFTPSPEELARTRQGSSGTRALDAGLLLTLLRPETPDAEELILAAAHDPDPRIRLRGLVAALRQPDLALRLRLRAAFRDDPSALIQRALERS